MSLLGIGLPFVAALAVELKGSDESKRFSRPAFTLVFIHMSGLTVRGIASFLYDVGGLI
jgi:hypothetical protein